MAEVYLNVGQEDLRISSTWQEDLTGYVAKLKWYLESAGVAGEAEKSATVSAGASESTVFFDIVATAGLFSVEGYYVFSFEITKSNRSRRCKPRRYYVNAAGEPSR